MDTPRPERLTGFYELHQEENQMKTLMLLLLISSPVLGQDVDSLLTQYEAECYADSTWTMKHSRWRELCWYESDGLTLPISSQKCVRPDHWKKYWKHREPTYQGLKEFLHKGGLR